MALKFEPSFKKTHIDIIHDYGYDKTKNVLIKEQKPSIEMVTCQGIIGTINPFGQEIYYNNPVIRLKQNYPICYFEMYDSSGNYVNQHRISKIYTGKKGTYYEIKSRAGKPAYPINETFTLFINTNVVCCFSAFHSSATIAKVYKNKETEAQTITDISITNIEVPMAGYMIYNYDINISTLEKGFNNIPNIASAIFNIDDLSVVCNKPAAVFNNNILARSSFFVSPVKESHSNDLFVYRNYLVTNALPTT